MKRKLKSRKGETLIETLAAILVISLGSAAFAGMVSVSAEFNSAALTRDNAYYDALSKAEPAPEGTDAKRGTVKVVSDVVSNEVSVTFTDDPKNSRLVSYRSAKGATP